MAKQTFTTGQVLTAAQMTSLQQTAMLGGDASVKVASYTLVAADAGTTVAMNSASTTTITVNTGLFAAGDTVFIQNRGAGVCTVTAGTAAVASAGSLALPQNDAGILYFTSASAATFYDFIQVGATSPLTTKGDLYGFSTSDQRIPIGANGTILTADSTESLGLKWAAAAGGGGLTLIDSTTFTSTNAVNVNNVFSATYDNYLIVLSLDTHSYTSNIEMRMRVSGSDNSNSNYRWAFFFVQSAGTTTPQSEVNNGDTEWYINSHNIDGSYNATVINVFNPFKTANTSILFDSVNRGDGSYIQNRKGVGTLTVDTSYTGFSIISTGGTTTGKVRTYGYQNS